MVCVGECCCCSLPGCRDGVSGRRCLRWCGREPLRAQPYAKPNITMMYCIMWNKVSVTKLPVLLPETSEAGSGRGTRDLARLAIVITRQAHPSNRAGYIAGIPGPVLLVRLKLSRPPAASTSPASTLLSGLLFLLSQGECCCCSLPGCRDGVSGRWCLRWVRQGAAASTTIRQTKYYNDVLYHVE